MKRLLVTILAILVACSLMGAAFVQYVGLEKPSIAAFPSNPPWYQILYEFDNEQGIDPFTGTALSSGSGAVTTDEKYGVYLISGNATSDNSGFQIQGDMETFSLNLGKRSIYTARVATNDATESEIWAGPSITDTTMLGGAGTLTTTAITMTDAIGFYKPDGSTRFYGVVLRDSVLTSVGPFDYTTAADTYVTLSIDVSMDSVTAGKGVVNFYINGVQKGQLASSALPYDSEEILTPAVAFVTGDNLLTKTLKVDYVGIGIQR